jgi:DNA-binding CsgD family transcriptional regulator
MIRYNFLMDVVNFKDQVFLSVGHHIREICWPLKLYFGITNFLYHKTFNDGSEIKLGTHPEWLECFLEHKLYQHSTFEHHPSLYQTGFVLWSQITTRGKILTAQQEFKIAHGITLINKVMDGCEFFFFGTTPDNFSVTYFYLNNIDVLERFARYFKERAAPLIQKAEAKKLIIPNRFVVPAPIDKAIFCLRDDNSLRRFNEMLQTNAAPIHKTAFTKFSKREMDCARYLLQGKTMKEIAALLSISPRTVETYFAQLKEKLACHTKSQLISELLRRGFMSAERMI